MISDADRWAPGYAELGAASVTFHLEAATDPSRSPVASARSAPAPASP
jgi:ribulose-phosphate 3-epimerase